MGIKINIFSKIKSKLLNKKIVVIAEKYSAAAEYAAALECKKLDNYFENERYIIVWTDGHICTLYNPEDYKSSYKKWSIDDLPIIPNGFWVKVRTGKQKKLANIKSLVEREDVSGVCIATDSAREGNLIGDYLLMAIDNKKHTYRVMINALNKKEILNGFKNMCDVEKYKGLSLAAQSRDEIDWLIGINFSRCYSLINNKKYYLGRVKTVILNFICDREKEIEKFKESYSYSVKAEFKSEIYNYLGILNNNVSSMDEAKKICDSITNKNGYVDKISKEIKIVKPDQLYNLNDLIRAANRRYGLAAEEVYDLAQKLYEDYKLISYARTDCRYIKSSMTDELKMILNCNKLGVYENKICDIKDIDKFVSRCVDDEKVVEHSAIIPVVNNNAEKIYHELLDKERCIYDLILENFINNFLDDYEYESILIETIVENNKFITRNKRVIKHGWNLNSKQEYVEGIKEGDRPKVNDITIEKCVTKPPMRYTDDTLFEVLENPGRFIEDKNLKKVLKQNGIGTNATRALLLKDLMNNEYVIRDKKQIVPTLEGREIIDSLRTNNLKEPFFTAQIEQKLQQIQEGKLNKDILLKEINNFVQEHIEELKKEYESRNITKNNKTKVIGNCLLCSTGKIVSTAKGYGCTNLKHTGCRFFIANKILGTDIDESQVYKIINNKETDLLEFVGKNGKFKARIIFDGLETKFKR